MPKTYNDILKEYQKRADEIWEERGYKADIVTLALGLCEEAGEVGKAINVFYNPLYIPKHNKDYYDSVEHELKDCLFYIAHIANKLGITLELELHERTTNDTFH